MQGDDKRIDDSRPRTVVVACGAKVVVECSMWASESRMRMCVAPLSGMKEKDGGVAMIDGENVIVDSRRRRRDGDRHKVRHPLR
jgi:hypothetical protein